MKEKHVILRMPGFVTRDRNLDVTSLPLGDPSEMKVEVEELSKRDVSLLEQDEDVKAIAPSIPMQLIEPLEVGGLVQPAEEPIAWGIKAVGADTSSLTGKDIVVAVLDTGIDTTHPAFDGITLIEKDFTGEGNGDTNGHGTHCAGTIFGRDVEGTRIGVARGVTKALIGKVLGKKGGPSDAIVSAIQWARENGAHVISMSLGMDFPGLVNRLIGMNFPPALATTRALEAYRLNVKLFEQLAGFLKAQGGFGPPTLVIAAAGNESKRDQDPRFEIAVSPPAVAEGIISVGALGESPEGLTIGSFSNTGPVLCGPGVRIKSAKTGGGLTDKNGTSMAAPHVAGVAALWAEKLKADRNLNPISLDNRLKGSANTTGLKAGFDNKNVGLGLVRAPQS